MQAEILFFSRYHLEEKQTFPASRGHTLTLFFNTISTKHFNCTMALMMTRYLLVCVLGSASLADADVMLKSDVDYGVLYPMLGKNNLDELTDNYTLEVDDECNYNLTVSWLQNPEFPVGGPDTCLPSVIADYDGNSMLEARWFYQEYPQYVQDAIDINHLSLDWNPCGRKFD